MKSDQPRSVQGSRPFDFCLLCIPTRQGHRVVGPLWDPGPFLSSWLVHALVEGSQVCTVESSRYMERRLPVLSDPHLILAKS